MRNAALFACLLLVIAAGWTASAPAGVREAAAAYDKGNFAAAFNACRADAEAGDARCELLLGTLYEEGEGVKADAAEAARWYRRAADQGNPYAAYQLANLYENGQGVKQDTAEAEKLFDAAARQGLPEAAFRLGILLLKADDNPKETAKLIRAAATHGVPPARSVLGVLYENGKGVRRNYRSAAKWYLSGAEYGDPLGATGIASLYERGLGVDQDLQQAYFWYRIAAADAQNPEHKRAEAAARKIAAQLPKAQVAAADQAIRDWHPKEAKVGELSRSRRRAAKDAGPRLVATGSGFFVSHDGHLLTNNHVIAECSAVRVTEGDASTPATVVASDPDRDLALLKLPHATQAAVFRGNEKLLPGESVVVVGFPLSGLLTTDPIVTTGIVSALAGPGDDRHLLQISAPIQPGNSGSPLVDASAHVIGVVVSSLSTMKLARATGSIPENINFAIKGDEARSFLKAHGIAVESAGSGPQLATAAIAEQALAVTVRVECWR